MSHLNKMIEVPTFRMETLISVITVVQKGDWWSSIDLKDAYLQVPMHPDFKRYLRFSFDGKCYRFKVLPFGISTAPRDDWVLWALSRLLSPHPRSWGGLLT